jgi:hypothetical protein
MLHSLTESPFQFDFIEDLVAPSQIFRALIFQGQRQASSILSISRLRSDIKTTIAQDSPQF